MKTLTADFSPVALLDDTAVKWHDRRVKSSFAAMRRRWWLIVLLGCVGLGGAATWLNFAKPQYSATALVQLDMRNKVSSFDNVVTSPREGDPNVIRTEVEVLRSNAVAERVVKALGLTTDPEFSAPSTTSLAKLTDLLPAEVKDSFHVAWHLPGGRGPRLGFARQRRRQGRRAGLSHRQFQCGQSEHRNKPPAPKQNAHHGVDRQNGVILGSIADDAVPTVNHGDTFDLNGPLSSSAAQGQIGAGSPTQNGSGAMVSTSSDLTRRATSSAGPLQDRLNEDKLALTIRQVKKNLTVDADGRSYIITIGFAASSAEKAALG